VSTTTHSHRSTSSRTPALRIDYALIISTLAVAVLGVVIVYSATRSKLVLAGDDPHYFLDHQAAYVVVGVIVMITLAVTDYRWLEHASAVLYVGIVLALLAMFTPVGSRALGATRWLQVGPVQIQPSSFAALALIVTVATFCARRPEGLDRGDLFKILLIAVVPIALVVKQPDLGSAIVMCIVLLVMLVVAGIPNRYLVLLLVSAVLGAFLIVHAGLLKPYQVERLTSFLSQSKDLQGNTYNLHESVAAIGSGGWWGTGLFHGPQTNLSYVPEQQTDFIFSAVGEQLGFVGAASVLALLGVLSWRVLRAAQLAADPFGRLLATGAFTLLAFSIFENAGMSMGIMPIAGIPLPFLSYGGSATVAFFAAVGVALSVHFRHQRR
jgi:rod shape determining protein RodA